MNGTRHPLPSTLRLESLEDRTTPATFNVTTLQDVIDPADGKRSLREAITAANNLAEPGGEFTVRNTIVALNQVFPGGSNRDVNGTFASQGHNLIGSGGGIGFVNGVNGDLVGTFLNPIDPKLGPLANNGGRTKTHALLAGSRAIDRGDNADQTPTD